MTAIVHDITGRAKDNEMFLAKASDFILGPPREVSPATILGEPGWSPDCLDPATQSLILVRLPPAIDLADAAFLYVTQYRHAEQLIVLPLAQFEALATPLPDPRLILVFSMGRCGTTLISHALNGPASVASLSEPDIFDQRAIRALPSGACGPHLLRNLCRLLFATRSHRGADALAIKFRSQSLFIADRFWVELPDARYVFMYRDGLGWAASFLQFMSDVGVTIPMDQPERDNTWAIISGDSPLPLLGRSVDLSIDPLHPDRLLAAAWALHLEQHARQRAAGVPFLALRYNELVADRAGELARLFAHCGLPADGIGTALTAFDEDSQKDTIIGRKAGKLRFTAENIENFRATLARTGFPEPDMVL